LHITAASDGGEGTSDSYWDDESTTQMMALERFKWFQAIGLDPMAEDKMQRTCLDNAVAKSNESILQLFRRSSKAVQGDS
jgi:hypothetical protein